MSIQRIYLCNLFDVPPDAEISLIGVDKRRGNIFHNELFDITTIAKSINAKNVFEIGTYDGRTAINLARNIQEDGRVFTLDLPQDQTAVVDNTKFQLNEREKQFFLGDDIGCRFKEDEKYGKKVTQLFGDSATFDFSPYYGQMDLVFIDGSHTTKYVESDTANAFKMINDNGVVIWHDYGCNDYFGIEFPEVVIYLDELADKKKEEYTFHHLCFTMLVVAKKNKKQ